jgi:hypothetical protein
MPTDADLILNDDGTMSWTHGNSAGIVDRADLYALGVDVFPRYRPEKPNEPGSNNTGSTSYPVNGTYVPSRIWDAGGQVWTKGTSITCPVKFRRSYHLGSGAHIWEGGFIYTALDAANTLWDTWHKQYLMQSEVPGFWVIGTTFYNGGDGIDFCGRVDDDPWLVQGCDFNLIHDDAIQNDNLQAGTIRRTRIRDSHIGLSCQEGTLDGRNNTVFIEDTLMGLASFHNSYTPSRYGYGQHGGFFKDFPLDRSPKLVIRNSVFMAPSPAAYGGPKPLGGLSLPLNVDVDGVLLCGWENWPQKDVDDWMTRGTNVRLGTMADWSRHLAAWTPDYSPSI